MVGTARPPSTPTTPTPPTRRRPRRVRLVVRLVAVAVALVVLYFGVTFAQVVRAAGGGGDEAPADAIIVLGAAQYDGRPSGVLRARLDHAVDLYERGVAPVVVVTGGRQPGDRFTEAAAAADYLLAEGLPEPALRWEVTGENSWQSLAAAERFLRKEGIHDVVLVSSPYHAMRTAQIAGEVGLDGRPSPAEGARVGGGTAIRHYVRETVAVGLGRIIGFRRLVNLDERVAEVRSRPETG